MDRVTKTEERNINTVDIDVSSSLEIARMINNEDKKIASIVETQLDKISEVIDLANNAFRNGGRVLYFGAGTSGRLGILDASEIYPTFSESGLFEGYIAGGEKALRNPVEGAEDNEELGLEDLILGAKATDKDIVVTISASGNPKYLTSIISRAREIGAKTVAITCNPKSEIGRLSDINICTIVGPEAITGSSRMKAGTSQKMILNMISTGALVKYGKTYGNLMVDVKTANKKLFTRAERILMQATDTDEATAKRVLNQCDYHVKTAIVMVLCECDAQEAKNRLESAGGYIREALK